jgi:hypothetical protein
MLPPNSQGKSQLANKIGYELGSKWTKRKYAFIVATHVDKAHIHNHIIFNSSSLDCNKKFRNFLGSGRAVGKISDRICLEYGLSIIEPLHLMSFLSKSKSLKSVWARLLY